MTDLIEGIFADNPTLHGLALFLVICFMGIIIAIYFKIKNISAIIVFVSMLIIFLYAWGLLSLGWQSGAFLATTTTLYLEIKQKRKEESIEE